MQPATTPKPTDTQYDILFQMDRQKQSIAAGLWSYLGTQKLRDATVRVLVARGWIAETNRDRTLITYELTDAGRAICRQYFTTYYCGYNPYEQPSV
jgi:hypothetical protein